MSIHHSILSEPRVLMTIIIHLFLRLKIKYVWIAFGQTILNLNENSIAVILVNIGFIFMNTDIWIILCTVLQMFGILQKYKSCIHCYIWEQILYICSGFQILMLVHFVLYMYVLYRDVIKMFFFTVTFLHSNYTNISSYYIIYYELINIYYKIY